MTETIEELYSADNWYKVEISRRDDGVLEVVTSKWTHEIVPGYGEVCPPFWEKVWGPSYTDTLVTARKLAIEELQRLSGSSAWKSAWTEPAWQPPARGPEVSPASIKRPLSYFLMIVCLVVLVGALTHNLTLPWLIRKAFTYGMWAWIYFLFVPVAKAKNRSRGWFLIGAASFWGVSAMAILATIFITLQLPSSKTPEGRPTREVKQMVVKVLPLGYSIGTIGMLLTARHLRRLPPLEK